MQFSVILGILLTILNKRKKIKREDLAKKYELSTRTISRYLDIIIAAGVPLESDPGIKGGYSIPDTYRLDRSFFSKEELKRLSTCVIAMQSSFDDGMNKILLDKISNMSQNKNDEKYLLKSDSLIIDTSSWTNPDGYRAKFEVINKAISEEFAIKVYYIDRHELKSERIYDPYSLVLKEGIWYLYGWCHLRRDFRLLKLSRIRNMSITAKQFSRKPSDVYKKLNEAFEDSELVDMEIEFSSTVLSQIEEWLGVDAIEDTGIMYKASAAVFGGNVLINKLLSFGSSIKVLSPHALKEELLIECRRILNNA
ncbi:MAG: YafY family transcriptional regulator [Firmicutes bacterium]|nr:YafY family transcriptional regulator [Bacillota bacterium]